MCLAPRSHSQVTGGEGLALDSTLGRARAFLDRDEPDSARVLYKRVLDRGWKPRAARIGLVESAIAKEDWSEGISDCRDLLSARQDDVPANYYLGICLRESGHFAEAASRLQHIAEDDVLYRDVLYQEALVRVETGEYAEAIRLGIGAARVHPDSPEVIVGLAHIFRRYIASTDAPEAFDWLGARADWWSAFARGELQRRSGNLREAARTFRKLRASDGPARALCDVSLARTSAAIGEDSAAEAWYGDAVDRSKDRVTAAVLFDDLKYLITDRELSRYRDAATGEMRRRFFRNF
ncbi:MAG TPA: hypothetical protein VML00_02535, partial [Bacteroidota bacterium]|nr:hypothetical protein [Bacteroidota bacterium]